MQTISGSNLRNVFFIVGGIFAFVGGLDAAMVAAGLPPLGFIPSNIAHMLAMAGAGLVGYAKTGGIFGDLSPQQQVAQLVQTKLENSQPVTVIEK